MRTGRAGYASAANAGSATTHFGERDDQVQIETMQRALDLGVTFFDTADRYMKGRHEHLLGRALKGRRDEATIAVGRYLDSRGSVYILNHDLGAGARGGGRTFHCVHAGAAAGTRRA